MPLFFYIYHINVYTYVYELQLHFINPYVYRTYGDSRPPTPPAITPVVVKTYEMQLHYNVLQL